MAKTKTTRSTAHKRTEARQLSSGARTASPKRGPVRKGPTIRKKNRSQLYLVLGVLALIVVMIGGFVLLERSQANSATTAPAQAVNATVFQEGDQRQPINLGGNCNGWRDAAIYHAQRQLALERVQWPPRVPLHRRRILPNCAAERWAMLNALSRFGTFTNVSQLQSYEGSISTFSFHGSSYTSQYIDFVPREISGNTVDSSGNYVSLDQLSTTQQQIFSQDDSAGSIPFIDVGNSYKLIGASYQYTTLQDGSGNSLSWQAIASSLGDTNSPIAQSILGTANYLTAAICEADGQQPGSVCQTPIIQQIEPSLGQTTSTTHAALLAASLGDTLSNRVPYLQGVALFSKTCASDVQQIERNTHRLSTPCGHFYFRT